VLGVGMERWAVVVQVGVRQFALQLSHTPLLRSSRLTDRKSSTGRGTR